jgi:polysaccharide biosynthesis transport protein
VSERSHLPAPDPNIDFAPLGYRGSSGSHVPEGRSIDIVRFAISIWKYLALGLIAGCGLGVLAYLYTGPVYVAETQVMVSRKASASEQAARVYSDRDGHIIVIKSDAVAHIALERHGLQEVFAKDKDPLKSVWENLEVKRISGDQTSFDNQLSFAYLHPDKAIAKKVVTAVVSAYSDWLEARRSTSSEDLYQTFLSSKKEMDKELTGLEDEYAQWRESVPVYISSSPAVTAQGIPMALASPYQESLKDIGILQRLNLDQLRKTKIKIELLKTMMANPEERESLQAWVLNSIASATSGGSGSAGGTGGGLMSSPTGKAELDQQLLTARLLEKRLLLVLGENHADVKNVRRQIETIIDFYQRQGLTPPNLGTTYSQDPQAKGKAGTDMAQTYLTILESKVDELEDEKVSLAAAYTEAETMAKSAATYEVVDQRYKDDISRKKKELDSVLRQITEFDMNRQQEGYTLSRTNDVRVSRSIKKVIKTVGAFGMLGLLAVFGLSYFREWYDTTLKTAEETRDVVGAVVMGAIPHFKLSHRASLEPRKNEFIPELVYYHNPGSREAEAYRSFRTTLFHTTKNTTDKIIQFTSAEPGDGKSTTAANVAIAIAQSGKKVLLIDADLRRPKVHTLFGLSQDVGLTDVLLHEIDWPNAVRPTRLDNLFVLTAGLCPDNPAELLSSLHLPEMLQAARRVYDFIIIDTPPILAVSDPAIIAPHIDGLLLVVRMGKNKRAVVERARERIDAHGIHLYGAIINDVDYTTDTDYGAYDNYFGGDKPAPHKSGASKATAGARS